MKLIDIKVAVAAGALLAPSAVLSSPRRPAKPAAKPTPKKPVSAKPAPPAQVVAPFELPLHDKGRGVLRGPVYLPKGSINAAFHRPVTASSRPAFVGGSLALITDGVKASFYGNGVTLDQKTQWVQINLQSPFLVHGVLLWHNFFEPRTYHDVIVQLADDANFEQNVRTVYNNDRDNSSGLGAGHDSEYKEDYQGHWIPIKAQPAIFVRIYSRGSDAIPYNEYAEVEVWATKMPGMMEAPFVLPPPSYLG